MFLVEFLLNSVINEEKEKYKYFSDVEKTNM